MTILVQFYLFFGKFFGATFFSKKVANASPAKLQFIINNKIGVDLQHRFCVNESIMLLV